MAEGNKGGAPPTVIKLNGSVYVRIATDGRWSSPKELEGLVKRAALRLVGTTLAALTGAGFGRSTAYRWQRERDQALNPAEVLDMTAVPVAENGASRTPDRAEPATSNETHSAVTNPGQEIPPV